MADPASYRPAPGAIPTDPGVYRFVDGEGRVLYVGKAKSLRARLSSYFQDPGALSPRIRQMVHTAEGVEWVVVGSEVEALTLEYSWIKEYTPRFNVVFRDNKSYPYLAISVSEEFPRVWVTRQEHRRGTRYLGPYTKVWAIRDTLDQLLTVFPMRSCAKTQFNQSQRTGRPCLYGHIGRCAAPCVGRIDAAGHRDIVDGLIRFMEGDNGPAIAERKRAMAQAAANEEYETAARYRDEIAALEAVNERNAVVFSEDLDADVFGVAFDELEASVQVFYVRGGRIRGQQAWISDEIAGLDAAEIVSFLLLQVYGSVQPGRPPAAREGSRSVDDRAHTPLGAIPSQIWVPALPGDRLQLEAWLAERRGGAVRLKNPRRGDKARLAETVRLNAVQALQRHKLARAGDITVRSQGLEELRLALDLERAPLRIECYDVSHTQGTHQVASMVVFEDGLAKKPDYRHFNVRGGRRRPGGSAGCGSRGRGRRRRPRRRSRAGGGRGTRQGPALRLQAGPHPRRRRARAGQRRPAGGRGDGGRRADRRTGQTPRGSVGARRGVPRHPAPDVPGSAPPPATARRIAPLRHRLPPQEEVEGHDALVLGRGRRARPRQAEGPPGGLRERGEDQAGHRRGPRVRAGDRPFPRTRHRRALPVRGFGSGC